MRLNRAGKMKRKIITAVVSVFAVLALVAFGAGWYMLDYALAPAPDAQDMAKRYNRMYAEYPYMRPWVDSLKSAKVLRDTFIIMPDGERHHAVYARNDSAAGRTAILVHGYKDSHIGMLPIAKVYADMGCNILLPDLHAHGLSDGGDIQMGWKDREDVIRWIGVADSLFLFSDGYMCLIVTVVLARGGHTAFLIKIVRLFTTPVDKAFRSFKIFLQSRFLIQSNQGGFRNLVTGISLRLILTEDIADQIRKPACRVK